MKWTVLSDNRSCPTAGLMQGIDDSRLATEHGLSILLEITDEQGGVRRNQTKHHRILLDTGASDVFVRNAEVLGVSLSSVDYVFISHGHSDHAGGLRYFLERNRQAKVIVSPHAMSGKFYSKRNYLHSITTAWPESIKDRLITVEKTSEIADGLNIIARIPQIHPMPKGNQNLFVRDGNGGYVPDDFRHELALFIDGLLFTGCAHSGLENILAACPYPVKSVVGGFHLLDGQESEEELLALSERLKEQFPTTLFYTSHCTGDKAFKVMKDVMGEQLQSFKCGTMIEMEGLGLADYPHLAK